MSAFVCIFLRDGTHVESGELHRLAEPLGDYGNETATFRRGPCGIAVRRADAGSRDEAHLRHGPLVDPQTGRVVAVAGRLDLSHAKESSSAGAATLAARCRDGDPDPFPDSRGSFAAVVADPSAGRIRITRDHLGSLGVYYFLDRRRLIAATEPAFVLRHPAVSGDPDEGSVARFLGFRFGARERSFFSQIRVLPPAHCLHVTRSADSVEQYWRFRRVAGAGDRPPEELATDFLRRLERSVADHVADLEPARVAVSLSGGLDSTAVAAVAPQGVRAFSWTFEDTPEADERSRIEAVAHHLDLPLCWVPGDGLHPLCGDFVHRFVHENSPYVNPFAALKCRLYEAAREAGCQRVLVGDAGDALYAAREYWLRDLLTDRKPGALRSLAATLGRAARGDRFARRSLRRLPPLDALGRTFRREPPWLTPSGRTALPTPALSPILPPGRGKARYELSVGIKHSELESEEQRLFAHCGVERGNPFWSWPLLEPAIQLPAYWYHRDGRDKPLTRRALRGLLPAEILEGERGGLLGRFFLRGIELHHADLRQMVFRRPRSDWQRYVRRAWLEPHLEDTRSITFGHTVLWRVISYELWCRRLTGRL